MDHPHRALRASRETETCSSSCHPSHTTEDYLDLLAAIEDTAAQLCDARRHLKVKCRRTIRA
ncbi:MAG: hypothetical protein QM760_04670 [Nibricoccus sp.]